MKYLAIVIGLLLLSCEGPTGPIGNDGPSGPGTRTVLTGLVDSDTLFVESDLFSIDDPPLVNVFICLDITGECPVLPVTFSTFKSLGGHVNFKLIDGRIRILRAFSFVESKGESGTYKVVIVK